ncbi:unnamed protein product, partial [Polarella glacialis]
EMGPTVLCPGTHNSACHEALEQVPAADRASIATLERFGAVHAVCEAGTAVLMDSRLLHCGGANLQPEAGGSRRKLLY